MAINQEKILEMREVYANYGPVPALTDVSLYVKEREIVTLLGANGAGKTTTLNTIYGVLPIVRGEVFFRGRHIKGLTPQKLVSMGICYIPEGGRIFAPMTVTDNLVLGTYSRRGKAKREEIERDFRGLFDGL